MLNALPDEHKFELDLLLLASSGPVNLISKEEIKTK
ncbi:MAG: hypothetical protein ACI86M_001239 [Saprospiraceae bacterium]|jgi:hypothetical protein